MGKQQQGTTLSPRPDVRKTTAFVYIARQTQSLQLVVVAYPRFVVAQCEPSCTLI